MQNNSQKTKLLIIGAGFGGISALKTLKSYFNVEKDLEVTIVNDTNHFLFTPILPEVATCGVSPEDISIPVRNIAKDVKRRFILGKLDYLELKNNKAHIKSAFDLNSPLENFDFGGKEDFALAKDSHSAKNKLILDYDYLIISPGGTTNYFGTPGAEENTFTLKNLASAVRLRRHFIKLFEKASQISDLKKQKQLLSFVVVGGGATGVELAAEMSHLFYHDFKKLYPSINVDEAVSISILDGGSKLLSNFDPLFSKTAQEHLQKSKVNVVLNQRASEVTKNSIKTADGSVFNASTLIWTAGVKANTPKTDIELETDRGGRVMIEPTLQLSGFEKVFVLGDCACLKDKDGNPVPMLAQAAQKQGAFAIKNLKRLIDSKKSDSSFAKAVDSANAAQNQQSLIKQVPQDNTLLNYEFKSQGLLVSLGSNMALADLNFTKLTGFLAFLLWKFVYWSKLPSISKRLILLKRWILDYFVVRDVTLEDYLK